MRPGHYISNIPDILKPEIDLKGVKNEKKNIYIYMIFFQNGT